MFSSTEVEIKKREQYQITALTQRWSGLATDDATKAGNPQTQADPKLYQELRESAQKFRVRAIQKHLIFDVANLVGSYVATDSKSLKEKDLRIS